tara:strand:- start:5780 stop:6079 length:300 start_codon:yes stop_codon:yes gene_type:complete
MYPFFEKLADLPVGCSVRENAVFPQGRLRMPIRRYRKLLKINYKNLWFLVNWLRHAVRSDWNLHMRQMPADHNPMIRLENVSIRVVFHAMLWFFVMPAE